MKILISRLVRQNNGVKKFSAVIFKLGINPVVDPPADILTGIFQQAGRSKGPVPVRGELNGASFIQTMVKFRGEWRLYINGPMLKASGLKVGDTADINIEFDPHPREVPMPEALASAFRKDTIANAAFAELTPSRQKEILRYIGSLKSQAAIEKSVERVLTQLRG